MSLKFVPPPERFRQFNFGLWVDDGKGFVVKGNLGAAKQSAMYRARVNGFWVGSKRPTSSRIIIAERILSEWYVLYDVPQGTTFEELPWVKEVTVHSWGGAPRKTFQSKPMTKEEYAEWRIRVELERRGIHDEPPF